MAAERDVDIAKNLRTLEWLKVEMVNGVASLLRAMLKGSEELIIDSLTSIIITSYLLGKRLGISFARLDMRVALKLRQYINEGHQMEKWYGDLTGILEHVEGTRDELR